MKILKTSIETIKLLVVTPMVVIAVVFMLMAVILLIPASFVDGAIEGVLSKIFKEKYMEEEEDAV